MAVLVIMIVVMIVLMIVLMIMMLERDGLDSLKVLRATGLRKEKSSTQDQSQT
jgi:predicted permease